MSFSFFRTYASPLLFYFFLTLIFLLEGLGWRGGRDAAFALVLIMPVFLYLLDVILGQKIIFPKTPTILYGGFLIFSAISTIFSLDVMRSFWYLLFYCSLGLVFIYVCNHREMLQRYIVPFIFTISFLVCMYSLFVPFLIKVNPGFFLPVDGGQYVYPLYGLHNSRGDLLLLPLLICLYYFLMGKRQIVASISGVFFVPFFAYSFSRSAYVSLFLALLTMVVVLRKSVKVRLNLGKLLFISCCLLLFGVLFFATTKEFATNSFLKPIDVVLGRDFSLTNKSLVSRRDIIFSDAIDTILAKPLFGVGPHNYMYISGEYGHFDGITTDTAHNIFLDVFSENGVVAGLFFITFLGYILRKSTGTSLYFFLILAMLLNFQAFYLYRFYSFFMLFFALLGLNTRVIEGKKENEKLLFNR